MKLILNRDVILSFSRFDKYGIFTNGLLYSIVIDIDMNINININKKTTPFDYKMNFIVVLFSL